MLRICLLGGIALEHDGAPIAPPAGRPARALLGWLALHPGPHARADLAARLWPDVLDSSARASLRSAAWALRGSLGPAADLLEADRGALGLRADAVWVDALEPDPGAGELLPGLDDEWVLLARDDHHDRVAAALAAQVDAADDPATALAAARRLAAHDPLGEEAHRRLMQAQADAGDVAAALTTHARLTDRLRRELGVAPSTATRELANDLRAPADRTLRFRGSDPGISTFGEQAAGFGGAAAARPALVGRETELAALRDAWVRAADGAGRLVLIEGEPGIGKTRLAAEVLAEARAVGARVARAAPPEVGGAPLDLWTELLRDLCEDVEPPPAGTPWVDDLATLVPSVGLCLGARGVREPARFGDPELVRARLLDAIAEAVAWAAADRPVALLLDDLHLADAGSVAALARVGRRLPRLALLVLATRRELPRRPEIDAVAHALAAREAADEPISLVPLPADAVAELARGAGLRAAAEIDQVVAAADGNPLLATASARAMVRGEQEPPRTLRGAVRADAARLAPEPLRLAELLAIAGRELTATELDALGLEDRPAAVAAGVDAGLLRAPQGRAGYRHALLRDAMVHDLPSARRAALHEQLADALQHADAADPAPARAAEMGRHLQAAGRNTEAAERLRQAGERARSLGAMPEALEFLAEAVALDP
ncbi:MAG: AAA family ATPase, partial [Solirubrobacteraceae bacterium]|nr:AAA family ATPase [Solirubrobacteraceae bacterium]